MSAQMRTFVKGLAIALVGLFGVAAASNWLLWHQAACSQPCKSLGTNPEPPGPKTKEGELSPACNPVELKLEVRTNHEIHAKQTAYLFYRLTATNRSCLMINLSAREWIYRDPEPWTVEVLGPNGEKPNFPPLPGGRDVLLYDIEDDEKTKFNQRTGLHSEGDGLFDVPPGRSAVTSAQVLDPKRQSLGSWRETNPPRLVSGTVWKPVPIPKGVEPPPESFSLLGLYSFKKTGSATVQAVWDHHDVIVETIRPHARFVPWWCQWISELFGFQPPPLRLTKYHLHAESAVVPLKVFP